MLDSRGSRRSITRSARELVALARPRGAARDLALVVDATRIEAGSDDRRRGRRADRDRRRAAVRRSAPSAGPTARRARRRPGPPPDRGRAAVAVADRPRAGTRTRSTARSTRSSSSSTSGPAAIGEVVDRAAAAATTADHRPRPVGRLPRPGRHRARRAGAADRARLRLGRHRRRPTTSATQLRELAARSSQRGRVYEDWGFGAQLGRGRGITALFAGPSGTGKTMAAEILAARPAARPLADRPRRRRQQVHRRDREEPAAGVRRRRAQRRDPALRRGGRAVRHAHRGPRQPRPLREPRDQLPAPADGGLRGPGDPRDEPPRRRWTPRSCAGCASSIEFPFPGADDAPPDLGARVPGQPPSSRTSTSARSSRLELTGGNIRSIAVNAAFLAAADGPPDRDAARRCGPPPASTRSSRARSAPPSSATGSRWRVDERATAGGSTSTGSSSPGRPTGGLDAAELRALDRRGRRRTRCASAALPAGRDRCAPSVVVTAGAAARGRSRGVAGRRGRHRRRRSAGAVAMGERTLAYARPGGRPRRALAGRAARRAATRALSGVATTTAAATLRAGRCARASSRGSLVGAADDPFEREAERTAAGVTRATGCRRGSMLDGGTAGRSLMRLAQRAIGKTEPPTKKDDDEKKRRSKALRRRPAAPMSRPRGIEAGVARDERGGAPLPAGVRVDVRAALRVRLLRCPGPRRTGRPPARPSPWARAPSRWATTSSSAPASTSRRAGRASTSSRTSSPTRSSRSRRPPARRACWPPRRASQRLLEDRSRTRSPTRSATGSTRDFPPWDLITLIIGCDPIRECRGQGLDARTGSRPR